MINKIRTTIELKYKKMLNDSILLNFKQYKERKIRTDKVYVTIKARKKYFISLQLIQKYITQLFF